MGNSKAKVVLVVARVLQRADLEMNELMVLLVLPSKFARKVEMEPWRDHLCLVVKGAEYLH